MFDNREVWGRSIVHAIMPAGGVTERARGSAQVSEVEGLSPRQLFLGPREHHV